MDDLVWFEVLDLQKDDRDKWIRDPLDAWNLKKQTHLSMLVEASVEALELRHRRRGERKGSGQFHLSTAPSLCKECRTARELVIQDRASAFMQSVKNIATKGGLETSLAPQPETTASLLEEAQVQAVAACTLLKFKLACQMSLSEVTPLFQSCPLALTPEDAALLADLGHADKINDDNDDDDDDDVNNDVRVMETLPTASLASLPPLEPSHAPVATGKRATALYSTRKRTRKHMPTRLRVLSCAASSLAATVRGGPLSCRVAKVRKLEPKQVPAAALGAAAAATAEQQDVEVGSRKRGSGSSLVCNKLRNKLERDQQDDRDEALGHEDVAAVAVAVERDVHDAENTRLLRVPAFPSARRFTI
ncbi:Hypothetical Protein FCC1311_100072 [Hondaea fermentalgiana]|uniref:Uncharacterized protein n=1 Tax=Hondaea fermentalgiana TaxID=2315210 RepID=A0A2R5H0E4_9STRA|nr:Hypothetical Protein FCC1311_100072 [Hondaea fermentalgiana]|eukprot:GBG33784.1 Hypothetical Protein FCC1311_100072 [Hondaea fermentalgiana]